MVLIWFNLNSPFFYIINIKKMSDEEDNGIVIDVDDEEEGEVN